MSTAAQPQRRGDTAAHVLAGLVVAAAGAAAFLLGREALAVFLAVVLLAAYVELRRILSGRGVASLIFGAAAVLGALWVAYEGRLDWLPWTSAGLILVLLVLAVLRNELSGDAGVDRGRSGPTSGPAGVVTSEIAATLTAAATVGILGAHVLLVRSVPEFGYGGLLSLALLVFAGDVSAFAGGRLLGRRKLAPRISPDKTWAGFVCGLGASIVVGGNLGLWFDPPFDVRSGVAFGAAVGVLAPLGDLAFSALKRSADARSSGRIFGAMGGALDVVDGLLFAAPAFYWAFRTIAL